MKVIDFIVYFCAQIYMVYILLKCYSHINKYKIEKNYKLYFILFLGAALLTTNNLYNFTQYKLLISFLIELLIFKFFYNNNIKETIINTIIIVIITAGLELILSLLLMTNTSLVLKSNGMLFKIIFSIIVFKMSDIIIRQDKICYILQRIINFMKNLIFFESTLILIVIIINIMLFFRSAYFGSVYNISTILIGLAYIILTLIQLIKSKSTIEKLQAKNKDLTNSYKASSAAMEQFKELKHNLKNDLYSIKSTLPKEKQLLLNNIINKYNTNYDWLNNVTDIPEGLQGIIYLKKLEAEKQKVKLTVNFNSTKEIREKDFLDICDILGIFIDNAIEASKENGNKTVVLDIRDYYDSMILKVINKFSNNINLNEIGNKAYSTKNRNSGLGLNYISKIKNKNIKTNMQIVNNLFIASIEYKIKENKK